MHSYSRRIVLCYIDENAFIFRILNINMNSLIYTIQMRITSARNLFQTFTIYSYTIATFVSKCLSSSYLYLFPFDLKQGKHYNLMLDKFCVNCSLSEKFNGKETFLGYARHVICYFSSSCW